VLKDAYQEELAAVRGQQQVGRVGVLRVVTWDRLKVMRLWVVTRGLLVSPRLMVGVLDL